MNFHYCCFYDGERFEKIANESIRPILDTHGKCFETKNIFTREWLEQTPEFLKNQDKFSRSLRGCGYWRWKPLVIKEVMKNLPENDIVCYFDVADIWSGDYTSFLKTLFTESDLFVATPVQMNEPLKKWCRRDVFEYLEVSDDFSEKFGFEAGMIAFKNCEKSRAFVDRWFDFCMDDRGLVEDKETNICGKENFEGFVDHRHDQAILSVMLLKENYPYLEYNGRYVNGNHF